MSNQKGGVGKSTLTILLASYLYFVKGKNVAVVDCDSPQHSLSNLREREKDVIKKSPYHQQLMKSTYEPLGKKAYPIINSTPAHARQAADDLAASAGIGFDIIFIDLPGTINSVGVLQAVVNLDYIITPIIPERMVMQSSLAFTQNLLDFVKSHDEILLKDVYFVWNRIDGRVSPDLLDAYRKIMDKLELKVLDTMLPRLCRYGKELKVNSPEFFRSTLFPPPKNQLKDSKLDKLADEICEILNL